MSESTPLMKQYKEIKDKHQNAILFFRVGDFYETFFEDAKLISKELGLTLTKRSREKNVDIPLAGVPYHSISTYISKLISLGYNVAICDQVENPKDVKGIVKREVTKIITPGTVIDTEFLDDKKNNYIMSVNIDDKKNIVGMAYTDLTTSEFVSTEIEEKNLDLLMYKLAGEINKIAPAEIVMDIKNYDKFYKNLEKYILKQKIQINVIEKVRDAKKFICDVFNIISISVFNLEDKENALISSANLINYIKDLQKIDEIPFTKISYNVADEFMELNLTTQNNLDLFPKKNGDSKATLLGVLDECITSMGSRYLKRILKNPILDINELEKRYDLIDYFFSNVVLREEIREILKNIYDIERIISKINLGTENGKDFLALKYSISECLKLDNLLDSKIININNKKLKELYNIIENTINENAPFSIREGGILKSGVSKELDELRDISENGKTYILNLEASEKQKTGIKTLKIKYSKIFGYFIEITKNNIDLVPDYYIRKQTLVNNERYIIPELKEYEDKILGAKSRINTIEYEIFKEISRSINEYRDIILDLSKGIAFLDLIVNFAHISVKNNYVRPTISNNFDLEIDGARHVIVENLIKPEKYIENDVKFDNEKSLIILTGPNMSGKSTYMKSIALNIIMSHIGCFVAAKSANIPLTDKIFTRLGASDDMLSGQSTFMLEMTEVANILHSATKNSFIILDEVGRGTSTYDGISIATSITEYIHNKIGAKTIFATHYHELTELEKELENSVNFRVEVKENGKEVIFLRKIVNGGADRSYGIEVAKLSGIPNEILTRARSILVKLEKRRHIIEEKIKNEQMLLFNTFTENNEYNEEIEVNKKENEILEELKNIDVESLKPIDALLKLNDLVNRLKKN